MGQDFLSQDEVDQLLAGVCGPLLKDEPGEDNTDGYKKCDLGRQEHIVRGRLPTLELISEYFAREIRKYIYNFIGRSSEISLGCIRVQEYSECIRNLVVPSNLNLFKCDTLPRAGLLVCDPNLIYLCLDSIFGSDGRFHARVEAREWSIIEQEFIDQFSDGIMEVWSKAFSKFFPANFIVSERAMNTQYVNVASPGEIVLVQYFTVELNGNTADFVLVFPYAMVEPIIEVLRSTNFTEEVDSGRRIDLSDVDVTILEVVELGDIAIGLLETIEVGNTIMLNSGEVKKTYEVEHE